MFSKDCRRSCNVAWTRAYIALSKPEDVALLVAVLGIQQDISCLFYCRSPEFVKDLDKRKLLNDALHQILARLNYINDICGQLLYSRFDRTVGLDQVMRQNGVCSGTRLQN